MINPLDDSESANTNQYKLYTLTVQDAARARLLEAFDRYEEVPQDDDNAAPVLAAGFWILLAAPFIALFLMGLCFGGGW
jgi:hypothetical protein